MNLDYLKKKPKYDPSSTNTPSSNKEDLDTELKLKIQFECNNINVNPSSSNLSNTIECNEINTTEYFEYSNDDYTNFLQYKINTTKKYIKNSRTIDFKDINIKNTVEYIYIGVLLSKIHLKTIENDKIENNQKIDNYTDNLILFNNNNFIDIELSPVYFQQNKINTIDNSNKYNLQLFNEQVIIFKGYNIDGNKIFIKEFIELDYFLPNNKSINKLCKNNNKNKDFKIIICNGSFKNTLTNINNLNESTNTNNLLENYKNKLLDDMFNKTMFKNKNIPYLYIFMGPFLNNNLMTNLKKTYPSKFNVIEEFNNFIVYLKYKLNNKDINKNNKILLIPSTEDILFTSIYPQLNIPFTSSLIYNKVNNKNKIILEDIINKDNIFILDNPSTLIVNNKNICINNKDIFNTLLLNNLNINSNFNSNFNNNTTSYIKNNNIETLDNNILINYFSKQLFIQPILPIYKNLINIDINKNKNFDINKNIDIDIYKNIDINKNIDIYKNIDYKSLIKYNNITKKYDLFITQSKNFKNFIINKLNIKNNTSNFNNIINLEIFLNPTEINYIEFNFTN